MNFGDAATWYAAIVGTAALALEVRRWVEGRPKLYVNTTAGMSLVQNGRISDEKYVSVNVTNRGQSATTITHYCLFCYPSLWSRIRNRPTISMVVTMPGPAGGVQLPAILPQGHFWSGLAKQDDALTAQLERGEIWAGIVASHRKRPTYAKVKPPAKPKKDG